jgi:hypothetical protein
MERSRQRQSRLWKRVTVAERMCAAVAALDRGWDKPSMDTSEWRRSYDEIKADPKLHAEFLARKRREAQARQLATNSETERKRRYRKANRDKALALRQANHAVERAIAAGTLVRPDTCSQCGCRGKIEAHHFMGYAQQYWLTIVWLCHLCHHAKHPRRQSNV